MFSLTIKLFFVIVGKHSKKSPSYILAKFLDHDPRYLTLIWSLDAFYDHRAFYINRNLTYSGEASIHSFFRSTYNNGNYYSDVNSVLIIILMWSWCLKYLFIALRSKIIYRPIKKYILILWVIYGRDIVNFV